MSMTLPVDISDYNTLPIHDAEAATTYTWPSLMLPLGDVGDVGDTSPVTTVASLDCKEPCDPRRKSGSDISGGAWKRTMDTPSRPPPITDISHVTPLHTVTDE